MRPDPVSRFESNYVVAPNGCWIWLGPYSKPQPGRFGLYGRFWVKGRYVGAHRWSYETFTGKTIPKGWDVHHKCLEPRCVNWRHLQPVTNYANQLLRRFLTCPKHNRFRHALKTNKRKRYCRDCNAERTARWRRKKRETHARLAG